MSHPLPTHRRERESQTTIHRCANSHSPSRPIPMQHMRRNKRHSYPPLHNSKRSKRRSRHSVMQATLPSVELL